MTTICRTHNKELKTQQDADEHSVPGCVVETVGSEYEIQPFNFDSEENQLGITSLSYKEDVYDVGK